MAKNILSLLNDKAFELLMTAGHYSNLEVSVYIDLSPILNYVRDKVGSISYENCVTTSPIHKNGVNMEMILNKDVRYAIRPLSIVNPYLYYFLIREITENYNWKSIRQCFGLFAVPHFNACAIPVVPDNKEQFHNFTIVLNWWNSIEQRSLELSLTYRFMFKSDIRNCYEAVNLQSIKWALALKDTEFENRDNDNLSERIIMLIQDMQDGHSFGMPQGSVVFDLVAEIILGYADKLLYNEIKAAGIKCDYEILRYRDEYRIFCNDKDSLQTISYMLQRILRRLKFDMNSQKTSVTEDLIAHSIKSDKLSYIFNIPIFNKKGCDFDGFQKHLLYIHQFARKYPNSGQVKILLSDHSSRINKKIKEMNNKDSKVETIDEEIQIESLPEKNKMKENSVKSEQPKQHAIVFHELKTYSSKTRKPICENMKAMCAIATQIAIVNVQCGHYALSVMSRLLSVATDSEKKEIISLVQKKLCEQPNSDYMQLWLQTITYSMDKSSGICPYALPFCKIVMGKRTALWNIDWVKAKYREKFPIMKICNKKMLKKSNAIIAFNERRAYYEN